MSARPIKVAVLVDLALSPTAGGHVKCWERFAEAAARRGPGDIDLTIFFSGVRREERRLAPHVRFAIEPPIFSTARIPFLSHVPDHTDLAPHHPGLARRLAGFDLLHTTDGFFAFARTAEKVARRHGLALINSVHTETPAYTRIYTRRTVERLFGKGAVARLLLDRLGVDAGAEARMRRRLTRHQGHCRFVLVSRVAEATLAERAVSPERVRFLGRGIDRDFYDPGKRDRDWLGREYTLPKDAVVALYVGRLSPGKNVAVLIEAMERAVAADSRLRLICAGEGEMRADLESRLGDRVRCPGVIDRETLARLYASADLFVFPSEIEVFANVVNEAQAAGLPVLISGRSGLDRLLDPGPGGRLIEAGGAEPWARALLELAADPGRRAGMGLASRRHAETHLASWGEVLERDLVPVWRQAAANQP
jgi:glycosyltransferase involved in cell wall biosynthesis